MVAQDHKLLRQALVRHSEYLGFHMPFSVWWREFSKLPRSTMAIIKFLHL